MQAGEFGLAAMSELVVERPATIFISMSSRFAQGVGHVWRVLTTVDLSASTCAWIRLVLRMLEIVCSLCQKVVDGTLWHVVYEGRAVPNEEGRQELEQRAPVFRTLASFWDVGAHEWRTNAVPSRASYTEEVQAAQRCSCGCVLTCMASWDSTAFLAGLSDACGLCVATGALHLWTQLLFGGAVRCNEGDDI